MQTVERISGAQENPIPLQNPKNAEKRADFRRTRKSPPQGTTVPASEGGATDHIPLKEKNADSGMNARRTRKSPPQAPTGATSEGGAIHHLPLKVNKTIFTEEILCQTRRRVPQFA
jgi:hypothetical protein